MRSTPVAATEKRLIAGRNLPKSFPLVASSNLLMKAIRLVTCALAACALAASAASIEQFLDINVTGVYQGVSTNRGAVERDPIALFRISSVNIVRALAIDNATNFYPNGTYGSNYFAGTLIYKSSLDGSITNVVIRERRTTNELDVTTNFFFVRGPSVVNETRNTTTMATNHVETGLMGLSFTSSSVSFTNLGGFSYGNSARTLKPVSARVDGTNASGFATLLAYFGGGGTATFNTNLFNAKTNVFAGTNTVTGPVQIQFKTYSPGVSPNDPTIP